MDSQAILSAPGGRLIPKKLGNMIVIACALACTGSAQSQTAVTEVVPHSFGAPSPGAYFASGLTSDSEGNLYGTTFAGGSSNLGVVYKLDTAGRYTILHNFTGAPDGAYPSAAVTLDEAGNLYGTTFDGGGGFCAYNEGCGIVYKLDANGKETVLHAFTASDGANPTAGVILDSAGNLYGTTSGGGASGLGVAYKLDTSSVLTVLHTFTGGVNDGANSFAGLIRDSAGNLYGTTYAGGKFGAGVVYRIDSSNHETLLYSFSGGADGADPYAGVVRDSAGNLYGATYYGGTATNSCVVYAGCGVVYKLDATGKETVLYSFTGGADGQNPYSTLIRDSAGKLYGTTSETLTGGGAQSQGNVFKVDTSGVQTVLHSFTGGADGAFPLGGVIQDTAGNLYGATYYGGPANLGVVYEVDTTGHESIRYTSPIQDGKYPTAGVIRDYAGNLYGTAGSVVYKLDARGNETALYGFQGGGINAGVIRDNAGNLYGTTPNAGLDYPSTCGGNCGAVFKIDTTGKETLLYSFTGTPDGAIPFAGVIGDPAGNLYGTTYWGGYSGSSACGYISIPKGCGVVYKLDTTGYRTVLFAFDAGATGAFPYAGVIRDGAGNLYGTAQGGTNGGGIVYKVDTSNREKVIYSFTGGADGGRPQAGLIADTSGNLYGTTTSGGSGYGVVYKVDSAGHETVLYTFTGGADGGTPYAGVIRDTGGNLYGTTYSGGAAFGVVYKVSASGQETVLYTFSGGRDGANPYAGVILDAAGNLYGTTQLGGANGVGVVFELLGAAAQ